jgi:RimK family alpha-L-glutamate ligase
MRVGVIGWEGQETNPELVAAWRAAGIDAALFCPEDAPWQLRFGDVALGRLDVLPTLDGIEPGMPALDAVARLGVRVLNPPAALVGAHDKLETARRLRRAGVPHPRTSHVVDPNDSVDLSPPFVVKPRYGSWGRDVFMCADPAELARSLESISSRPWFMRHGALVQELVPPRLYDLRVIVAGGCVVGAARRDAAAGNWRTNVSLGGSLSTARPDPAARTLALAAAAAVGIDLAGVDLLPLADGGYVVVELNGAVDFDERYSLPGGDAYLDAAAGLGIYTTSVGREVGHLSA